MSMVKKDEGSFLGGLASNPSLIAVALVLGGLFIFRKQISEGLSSLFSPTGPIFKAGADAGQFVFNIGQDVGGAVFDAGAAAGQSVFDAGAAFGDFVGSTQAEIDKQLSNFFKVQQSNFDIFVSNLGKDVTEGGQTLQETAQKAAEEGGPLGSIFDLFNNFFNPQQDPFQGPAIEPLTGEFTGIPFTGDVSDLPFTDLFSFAEQAGITPAQAFQLEKTSGLSFAEIAQIPTFGEVLEQFPQLTASQIANLKFQAFDQGQSGFDFGTNTGMALEVAELSFGQKIENLDLTKAFEEFKASFDPVFGGTSNFANPDFPITAGEAFLGKKGSIVSPSISNLTDEQLQDFLSKFG